MPELEAGVCNRLSVSLIGDAVEIETRDQQDRAERFITRDVWGCILWGANDA